MLDCFFVYYYSTIVGMVRKKELISTVDELAQALAQRITTEGKSPYDLVKELIIAVEHWDLLGVSKKRIVIRAMELLVQNNSELVGIIQVLDPLIESMVVLLNTHVKLGSGRFIWC